MATVTQLNVEIGAKLDKLEKGLGQANRKLDGFGDDVKDVDKKMSGFNKTVGAVGKSLIGVFAGVEITRAVGDFISDAGRMAAEAQGVERAFNKLNRPGLLSQLQASTRGTVNNLELMRRAVQANNFRIPLERLGTFFQFATNRAIETGESVDFLVQSIVNGIGRKSPLILDNLGISAAELSAEVKKVGDFGQAAANIIEREMAKAGEVVDTAATSAQAFSTAIDNLKLTFGNFITSPGAIGFTNFLTDAVNGLNSAFRIIFSVPQQGATPLTNQIEQIRNEIQAIDRLLETDRDFGLLSNLGISRQRTEEETNELIQKRQELIKQVLALVDFENKKQQDKNTLIDLAKNKTDELKDKTKEAAQAQQEQFRELQKIIGGGTSTLSPIGNFKILQEGEQTSVLDLGISDDFTQSVLEGLDRTAEKLNENIAEAGIFGNELNDLKDDSDRFTNALTFGLGQIVGLLFQSSTQASKFGRILGVVANIGIGILSAVLPATSFVGNLLGAIPILGSGGIVDRPTLALIGESGPEAVVPLSRGLPQISNNPIRVTGEFTIRGTDLALVLDEEIQEQKRTQGF